ncbi:DUF6445 family protein [Kordiimonas aquimaris]|uniref:DUF6445 family protein n=1 Tax=Kordiimonas aquimaris TaxID=707591 RepID=UPI0021D3E9E8|nr:DUF6445 family protein [Kordiimonas aquimaris]
MVTSLIIIDDFLKDPHALRDLALKQNYPEYDKLPPFPGRNSEHRQVINGLDRKISEIVGEPLVPVEGTSYAKFRLALDGDKGTHSVHIDNVHWTSILFLTLPEHCQDGTHLFHHIETGTDRAPYHRDEYSKYGGATTQQEVLDNSVNKDSNDPSKWGKIMTVPMRFNRMMLFRPQQWHDAGLSFGDCPENGRLVYLSFYNNANG